MDLLGFATPGDSKEQRAPAGKLGKRMVQVPPIQEFSGRSGSAEHVAIGVCLPNGDNPAGIAKRQRPEQDAIHDTEDCGVSADSDGKSEYSDSRKARASPHYPPAIAQIVPKRFHGFFSRQI